MNKYLELGQIVNVKGLKGEVKVNSFTDDNTKFERITKVFLKRKDNLTEYEIEKVGYHKNQVIIKFKNVNTVEEAEKVWNEYFDSHRNEDNKICGDVDYDKVFDKVSAITPVPGGVGPMTIAMLMNNCLEAATKIQK